MVRVEERTCAQWMRAIRRSPGRPLKREREKRIGGACSMRAGEVHEATRLRLVGVVGRGCKPMRGFRRPHGTAVSFIVGSIE
jgi:hypothetical protein